MINNDFYAYRLNEAMNETKKREPGYKHCYYPNGISGDEWIIMRAVARDDQVSLICKPGHGTSLKSGQLYKEILIDDVEIIQEEIRCIVECWAETGEEIEAWMYA